MIIEVFTMEEGDWKNPSYYECEMLPREGDMFKGTGFRGQVVPPVAWSINDDAPGNPPKLRPRILVGHIEAPEEKKGYLIADDIIDESSSD